MNYIQRLAVLSFTAVSILGLSACTTTAVLTPEEALKKTLMTRFTAISKVSHQIFVTIWESFVQKM